VYECIIRLNCHSEGPHNDVKGYRLTQAYAFRALAKPVFFRSTIRGSLFIKLAFLKMGSTSGE